MTKCTVDMHKASRYRKWLMVYGSYRQSSNFKKLRPWLQCIYLQLANKFREIQLAINVNCRSICDQMYSGHAQSEQEPQVVDGIWCISPKFKPQITRTVASMYISAAGQPDSDNSAGQNDNSHYMCDKHYNGHALREQVPQVVDGNGCKSSMFKPQIIKTVASMYIFAAVKPFSGNSAGQNDNSRCICDKLSSGHA